MRSIIWWFYISLLNTKLFYKKFREKRKRNTLIDGSKNRLFYIYEYIMDKKYFTYILLTEQNTLYCGYTDDVEKRFQAHLEGRGAKYTRSHKPIKIVYQKEFETKSDAMKEERRIKKLSRFEKLKLINNIQ